MTEYSWQDKPEPAVKLERRGRSIESDVREKILETARCISLRGGYKGTTTNNIARAAGISPPTIYLRFNGKKDLFENLDISEEEALQDAYNVNHISVLQMALILSGEYGYDGVSMGMLARESGYFKATFYQHFKDKERLYPAVMQETPFHFNLLSTQPEIDGCGLGAAIERIGLTYLAVLGTPERIAFTRAIIRDSKRRSEVSSIYRRNGTGYTARCVETVLKKYTGGLQEGADLYPAIKIYAGSPFRFAVQYRIAVGAEPQYEGDEVVDTLTRIFLHGIPY